MGLIAVCMAVISFEVTADEALVPLAARVLRIDADTWQMERAAHPADNAELHLFIGIQRPELRLRTLSLRIDDQPALGYEYSEPEWEALAAGALHPALTLRVPAGEHRVQVELAARALGAGPTDSRTVVRVDQQLALVPGMTLIEASLMQPRFGKAELLLRDATPPTAPDATSAWSRAARYWQDAGRPYLAARSLQRAGDSAGALRALHATAAAPVAEPDLARFNAAAAAVAAGDAQALGTLEQIGTLKADSAAAWALRDRANLLLGYQQLRLGDSKAALEAFGRVRSPGPQGNAALLGFGWAFLVAPRANAATAPTTTAPGVRPAFITALDHAADLRLKDRADALKRALVPWTELIGRDPLDPAAQEGSLALAWAMDQLHTGTQAHTYYERAADALELARALLDQAQQHVSSGQLAAAIDAGERDANNGWRVWMADLPYAKPTAYLQWLLDDVDFIEALDRYRDTSRLAIEIDTCAQRLLALPATDGALPREIEQARAELEPLRRSARTELERRALQHLRTQKVTTERYLAEARFALAQHYDNAPQPESDVPARKVRSATGGAS